MKDNRRNFIRKSVGFAAAVTAGNSAAAADLRKVTSMDNRLQEGYVRDAGMQMSEAYFDGFNQHKIALCRQMDVLGP